MFEVGPAGEGGLRLVFLQAPHPALTRCLLRIQSAAKRYFGENMADSVVGYTTLTLLFHPLRLERDRAYAWLTEQAECAALADSDGDNLTGTLVTLPVLYHPLVAPDLEWLADQKNMSLDQIVALHTGTTYLPTPQASRQAFAIGGLPAELALHGLLIRARQCRRRSRVGRSTDCCLPRNIARRLAVDRVMPEATFPERRSSDCVPRRGRFGAIRGDYH